MTHQPYSLYQNAKNSESKKDNNNNDLILNVCSIMLPAEPSNATSPNPNPIPNPTPVKTTCSEPLRDSELAAGKQEVILKISLVKINPVTKQPFCYLITKKDIEQIAEGLIYLELMSLILYILHY